MPRTSYRWEKLPGNFDTLHATQLFPSDNCWGIPNMQHTPVDCVPDWIVPYRQQVRTNRDLNRGAVHFFIDDYRFEGVWHRPNRAVKGLKKYKMLLTPDFSLYRDWPIMLQMWNTYRSRWVGCFWQSRGFTVIPTVSWSSAESYTFCFAGLPKRGIVAVSALGVNMASSIEHHLFVAGFQAMVQRLQPVIVLSCGRLPKPCYSLADVMVYPTIWTSIRDAVQNGNKQVERIQEAYGRQR